MGVEKEEGSFAEVTRGLHLCLKTGRKNASRKRILKGKKKMDSNRREITVSDSTKKGKETS